jgi:hypothetical protein
MLKRVSPGGAFSRALLLLPGAGSFPMSRNPHSMMMAMAMTAIPSGRAARRMRARGGG